MAGSSSGRTNSARSSAEKLKDRMASHGTVRGSLIFESNLLQEAETVEVKLPRGPAAFCTPRINGRPPKGSMVVRKSYAFTVEPEKTFVKRTRIRMRKEERMKIRNARKSPEVMSSDNMSLAETDALSSTDREDLDPQVKTAIRKREHYYDRASFRQERAQKFGNEKRFPVLVSSKLMPQWQESEYGGASSDEEGAAGESERESVGTGHASIPTSERRRAINRLQKPTLILAVRQEGRRPIREPSMLWNAHSDAGEVKKLCSRSPVLFNEQYNPPSSMTYRDTSVDNWVDSDGFKLPSIAGAKRDIEFNAPKIDEEIAESRAKGHRNRDQLEVRLENRLEAYKKEQEEPNFALRELEFERRGKDPVAHTHTTDGDASTESMHESFAERMSIGFSRYRLSRLHLPSDMT